MDTQYNVYFAGEILPGHSADSVRANLGKLFNANEATLDALFSGELQPVKKRCDKATAIKYKQAMERAGARPVIKRTAQGAPGGAPEASTPTRAERIAAAAAGKSPQRSNEESPQRSEESPQRGEESPQRSGESPQRSAESPQRSAESPQHSESAQHKQNQAAPDAAGTVSLAEPGSEVLRPEERQAFTPQDIDTSSMTLGAAGETLSEITPEAASPPDVSHLQMGEVGDDIPNLPRHGEELEPDTSAISLAPEGTDFSDCAPPEAEAPALELDALELAPEGSDVLDARYRRAEDVPAPATDHIQLAQDD